MRTRVVVSDQSKEFVSVVSVVKRLIDLSLKGKLKGKQPHWRLVTLTILQSLSRPQTDGV
jgi:hypothetical protein